MTKRPLRIQCIDDIFVCSNRCHDNNHLIPTDPLSMSRILGAMARCATTRSVEIYAYSFLPNGFWLILSAPKANRQNFMRDFQSWVARMGNNLCDRSGSFFHERYDDEAILDADKLVETYVDVLVAPIREGFSQCLEEVSSSTSWHALRSGTAPVGTWIDRDELRSLRRSNPELDEEACANEYVVELESPPLEDAGRDVDEEQVASWLRQKVEARIEQILKWQDEQNEDDERWQRNEPHPAPRAAGSVEPLGPPKYRYGWVCRTDSNERRERYLEMRREVRADYTEAMTFWRKGKKAFCEAGYAGGESAEKARTKQQHPDAPRGQRKASSGSSSCEKVDFPTSSIPPGWTTTRHPLRHRQPTPPQDRPSRAA